MAAETEKEERAYVYMVRCAGGQLYTGWTNNPASRLHAHKSGKGAKCTAPGSSPEKADQGAEGNPVRRMG